MSLEPIRWITPPEGCAVQDEWAAALVDEVIESDYPHEFLAALFFDPFLLASLAGAGFLLMTQGMGPQCLLLPKLHLERAVLDPRDFRLPKGLRGKLAAPRLRLRV